MGGFRGDLSTLGLADIFQTLSNSQKEGTLVVGDGESRKCIYFGTEGLSLLSFGSRKGLRIGDLLLKKGKISPDQLKGLLTAQKGSGKRLGELIVERGFATDQEISELIRTQIEDEIFDLFSWKKASFEFIDGPPAPELKDADRPVTSLKFDVNSLLFEASRRIDEWNLINQAIPNANMIFVLTEAGEEIVKGSEDASIAVIGALADATRTVDQIVEESGLSRFQACKALYTFLTKSGIRQVSQDELTAMGKRLAYQGERDRAIRVLSCAADLDHQNLIPRQELALLLRQAGMRDEAHSTYSDMARILEERGQLVESLQAWRQALDCKPADPAATYSVFRLLDASGARADASRMGDQVLSSLLSAGDREHARQVGETLIGYTPADTDLRLRIAAIALDLGDQEGCGRHLAAAIDHLPPERAGDIQSLAKKVLQILPNRNDIRFKLERVFNERRAGRKRRLIRLLIFAGIAAGVAVIALFGWYEIQARKAWAQISREAQAFTADRKWDQAKEKYREIQKRYGLSIVSRQVADRIAEVEALRATEVAEINKVEEQRKVKAREEEERQRRQMQDARRLEDSSPPDLPAALKIYKSVLEYGEQVQIKAFIDEAGAASRRLEEYLKKAGALAAEAQEKLQGGDVEGAHARIRDLLKSYPRSPSALSAQLPYLVMTAPTGADVFSGSKLLGKTPLTIQLAAADDPEIIVRLRTFEETRLRMASGTPRVNIELRKQKLWRQMTDGAIETTPVVDAGHIIVGSLDGKLYAYDAAAPQNLPWKPFETGTAGQIRSNPISSEGRIFFGAVDNFVYCVDSKTGSLRWKKETGKPVKGSPALTEDGALVLIGSEDGKLWAFEVVTGTMKWQLSTGKPVRSRPWCSGSRAYFGCEDGKVRAVDLATGKELWSFPTAGPVSGPIASWNSLIVAGSEDGLYHINLDGKLEWKYSPAKGVTGGACVSGDLAFFGAEDSLCGVDLRQRKEAWDSPFPVTRGKAIRGTPVVGDEAVYFGAEDGILYAITAKSGELRWKYATEGPILGSPALAGNGKNYVFVGSGDKYLYALER